MVLILIIVGMLVLILSNGRTSMTSVQETSVDQLAASGWTPGRLVDVRSAEEFAEGHVPGAVNVPLDDVVADPGQFGPEPLQIICRSGGRSAKAAEAVEQAGTPAMSIAGGTAAWIESGRHVDILS
ncbi:rhodanese-like domain-containing protein [Actinomycetospora sp. NBRC 106375]|uniref:rhodanese-like domain-containing protein n=1 Tax=Actinomycetospora sp. NBRC 106375 TaxID=3032207 RepID=UPI0025576388|nr:rhodanese-like domain-containing protein [Actinomycetospora sp. NBRC 106375]